MNQFATAFASQLLASIQRVREGQRVGKLTVIGPQFHVRDHRGVRLFLNVARCECGTTKAIKTTRLASGRTKSCGCMRGRGKPSPTKGRKPSTVREVPLPSLFEGRPVERCAYCGARVYAPCMACEVRTSTKKPKRAAV